MYVEGTTTCGASHIKNRFFLNSYGYNDSINNLSTHTRKTTDKLIRIIIIRSFKLKIKIPRVKIIINHLIFLLRKAVLLKIRKKIN